jgi:ferric-dicitrate binding protein FerR (iron transport regulator)
VLAGGNFKKKCGASGARASAAKVVRQLWGSGASKFRTKGRYASATIRGTVWNMTDRCDGTLTKVTQGSVTVGDFKKAKNVVVKAGKTYLAKA